MPVLGPATRRTTTPATGAPVGVESCTVPDRMNSPDGGVGGCGALTVSVIVPAMFWYAARTSTWPERRMVNTPLGSIVATSALDVVHCACVVTSRDVPSDRSAFACI